MLRRLHWTLFGAGLILCVLPLMARPENEPQQKLYLSEDFNKKGLFFAGSDGDVEYSYTDDGTYKINAIGSPGVGRSLVLDTMADFDMSVNVKIIDSDESIGWRGAGVLFRVKKEQGGGYSYHTFNVDPVGRYQAGRFSGGKLVQYYPSQEATSIVGGWNTLKVRCRGQEITLYINDVQVSGINDDSLGSGGYGLYVTPGVAAEFDDFKVYLPGQTEPEQVETASVPEYSFELLKADDFSGQSPLFYEGADDYSSFEYTGHNSYRADLSKSDPSWSVPSTVKDSLADGKVSADVFFLKAPDPQRNKIGVVFRNRPRDDGWSDYYAFYIHPSGYYGLLKVLGTKVVDIVKPAKTNAFKQGEVNTLAAVFQGKNFYLVINGKLAGTAEDEEIVSGGYGLYQSGGAIGEFQNFKTERIVGLPTKERELPVARPDNYIDLSLKTNDYFICGFEDAEKGCLFPTGMGDGFLVERKDGGYRIDARGASADANVFVPGRFNKYAASVKVKRLEGDASLGFGMLVQTSPSFTTYMSFAISDDGHYKISLLNKGESSELAGWTSTDLVKPGEVNELAVKRVNDNYSFYINGTLVEMFPVAGLSFGGVGLVAGAGALVLFDDFEIKAAE